MKEKQKEGYLGDLEKTEKLIQLLQTPAADRDDKWTELFLSYLPQASFRCGNPQVLTGPDGMPYFELLFPEPNVSFQCFVIEHITKDFLISSGLGVVINSTEGEPFWVFSYGDMLNFHLNNSFYIQKDSLSKSNSNIIEITKEESVLLAQPSEELLPKVTRKHLSDLFKNYGIEDPKVVLMMREGEQSLVFNVTPDSFEDKSLFDSLMHFTSWYLPRHYSILGIEESIFGKNFESL